MRQPSILSGVLLVASVQALAADASPRPAVDYVSPNIGGVGQLLSATMPFVQVLYGMARLVPVTTPGIQDRYLAGKIYGFSPGAGMLMVSTGEVSSDPAAYASDFDHDFEMATPYYYAVDLQTWASRAEYTATQHAGFYRFTLPASSSAHISLSMGKGAELTVVGLNALQGSQRITGTYSQHLQKACQDNLVSEEAVRTALTRVLTGRFLLGEFDHPADVPWSGLSPKLSKGSSTGVWRGRQLANRWSC
jgi:putative alpha-1,2-mannosidase